ncbi:DUF4192 domain-containing protein [Arthrobacter sp. VKM Ac-2550]|uniref:DUF4192 domain-containing protein n=1 Tax=Crystallibacter permensis TaxID=1938888 RepID=UPI00222778A1|nr:DUF4192 domain-containing protein [Arthrobacter sp. VKM Ac-2550]MCW2133304.1 protein of unknown function (DUF4192) [Arthrobacter sp. VKM Ac-2550]
MNKQTIHVSRPEDILGYIPHALEFQPRQSLVLLSLNGKRLGATLRLDLPTDSGEEELARFADAASAYLRKDSRADSSLLVLYTDALERSVQFPPYETLLDLLLTSLDGAGLPVRDGWVVGPEHFRCLHCKGPGCCPAGGHPVERIAESTINAEMIFRGSSVAPSVSQAVALRRSGAVVAESATAMCNESSEILRMLEGSWHAPEVFRRTLLCWDAAIRSGPGPERIPFLLASLTSFHVRDAVIVLICRGLDAAYGGAVSSGVLTGTEPPGMDVPLTGPFPCATWKPGKTLDAYRRIFDAVLLGNSSQAPQWTRVDRAADLLVRLYCGSEGPSKAAAGTLLAWIEWARGRGSMAHEALEMVLQEFPDYSLARLLNDFVETGILPVWAMDRDSSWSGSGERAA